MLLANAMGYHHAMLLRSVWAPNRMERLECTCAGDSRQVWERVPASLPLPWHIRSTAEVSLGQAGQDRVALLSISILGCYHSDAAYAKCPQRTYK